MLTLWRTRGMFFEENFEHRSFTRTFRNLSCVFRPDGLV